MRAMKLQREITRWDHRFMDLAKHIASWSKDPSTKVGSVIVDGRRVVATGFNGLPTGVEDTIGRLHDRELKYQLVVHAERNAIIGARQNLSGYSLYVWPMMPCSVCAAMIIQAGISEVLAPVNDNPRWVDSFALTEEMFAEAGIDLIVMDAPQDESLSYF
ncbi:MAG: deoxycytidylate deaminase [Magnetospiraceae bacterium]